MNIAVIYCSNSIYYNWLRASKESKQSNRSRKARATFQSDLAIIRHFLEWAISCRSLFVRSSFSWEQYSLHPSSTLLVVFERRHFVIRAPWIHRCRRRKRPPLSICYRNVPEEWPEKRPMPRGLPAPNFKSQRFSQDKTSSLQRILAILGNLATIFSLTVIVLFIFCRMNW